MPDSLEYPMGDQLKMSRDPEGQTKWYDMSSLQTVPYQIVGIWHCFAGTNSPIDWQNMWVKDFICIALVCSKAPNYNLLCKLNEPLHCHIIQSLGWPSFS